MASKGMTLNIKPDQVMATQIRRSKGGYNAASMAVMLGENEYLSINYEWQGDDITDTAMDFMSFVSANKETIEASIESHKDEAAKKGKLPPWMKDDDEEEDDDKKSKKDKKSDKDKKSKKSKK